MNKEVDQYLSSIKRRHKTGISTEHTFRADLQTLIENTVPQVLVTNEPARIECGAPDYIIQRKEIPVGYIEAKNIGVDLDKAEKTDQLKRYRASLDNLILTDYLQFRFFKHGEKVHHIRIAEVSNNKIIVHEDKFDLFLIMIHEFCSFEGQTIKSSSKLAKMMAKKARLMEDIIYRAVCDEDENNTLKDQFIAFKKILIHDLDEKKFADIYAQTIAYGLFAARLNDPSLEDFSREEALFLVPKSNPFLRQLFTYVAGPDLDDRVVWIVNDLADIFQAIDLKELLKDFGISTQQTDPFMHFFETFLAEYDPKLRKSRGVYYTPEPVVNFIVRAVDDILKTEFDLPQGLADTSKVKIKKGRGKKQTTEEYHKVQILDPATGTGTFLAEVVRQVYTKFEGQQGAWNNYVKDHLIPRLNGFEILMASYTMAHLKLDMLLRETGYKHQSDERFRIFLTNSLEEAHADTGTLFASWLSHEAAEANHIKRNTPVMVVLGNPPYSVSSSNRSKWIEELMKDYKTDLNERNIQPLSDDYIKFIRYGEHFIEKNGEGILAFISNNSFIDGIIHRQMRKHLLETFEKVYILDLHGNSKKKETTLDGSKDQNVFDIMQGVSINIFVKKSKRKKFGNVNHADLYGKREEKYFFLFNNSVRSIDWNELENKEPEFFFIKKDYEALNKYKKGINIDVLFNVNATGIKTERDVLTIQFNEAKILSVIEDLKCLSIDAIRAKHKLSKDGRDWKVKFAKKDILSNPYCIANIVYRPFDYRFTAYTGTTKGFMAYPRNKIMKNLFKENLAIISTRTNRGLSSGYIFITKNILDLHLLDSAADSLQTYPLYIYTNTEVGSNAEQYRTPNLNIEIVEQIAEGLDFTFTNEKEEAKNTFAPIDILDYIYAILHRPSYREKYEEFLKTDFPSVPYPKNKEIFWQFVKLGGELRQIHLLEPPVVDKFITTYPKEGDNIVVKPFYADKKVWINDEQYFDNVPQVAWEFYIGGYQPAQKWLKDRKGRKLKFEDIQHYQKIIVALTETDRIMKEIDKIH